MGLTAPVLWLMDNILGLLFLDMSITAVTCRRAGRLMKDDYITPRFH